MRSDEKSFVILIPGHVHFNVGACAEVRLGCYTSIALENVKKQHLQWFPSDQRKNKQPCDSESV